MFNSLEDIHQEIIKDGTNADYTKRDWLPIYTVHENAKIVIIGQAPGRIAQEKGVPWDDRSGDRLRDWLGVDRDTFYDRLLFSFLPMDFYFPGSGKSGDLPPRQGFADKWHPLLLDLMPEVKLKIVIGQYAQAYYLKNKPDSVTDTVKDYERYLKEDLLPLPHPSPRNQIWQKKNPWFDAEVLPVLRKQVANIVNVHARTVT